MLLTPPSVTNCHTFSDPLPLERDVLYGRPPIDNAAAAHFTLHISILQLQKLLSTAR